MKTADPLALARVRLAQRLLLGAVESNPEYLTDDNWQAAMQSVAGMLRTAGHEALDESQLLLFPGGNHESTRMNTKGAAR